MTALELFNILFRIMQENSDAANWPVCVINHMPDYKIDGVVFVENVKPIMPGENKLIIIPEKLMTRL